MNEAEDPGPDRAGVSRRGFLKGAGLTVAGMGLIGGPALGTMASDAGQAMDAGGVRWLAADSAPIRLTVNGQLQELNVAPCQTLLDTLRDRLDLTGAKRVCDRGSCGACAVLVDGRLVNSCTFLAVDATGREVHTVESVAREGQLSPLQRAFVDCDALQCGFCTPGMIMACTALLARHPQPTRAQIAEGIAGNLCRCGTYPHIFQAVERAARAGGAR